jgi:hypothetical protein
MPRADERDRQAVADRRDRHRGGAVDFDGRALTSAAFARAT